MLLKSILAVAIIAGVSLVPICAQSSGKASFSNKKTNVLLIITDDHACSALGTNGHSLMPLPSLNKLGREGMVFERSYCCNSLCGPSRAAILTGRHSHRNGFVSNVWNDIDGSQPNYAKLLSANGYETAYFGKWHMGSDPTGFKTWKIVPGQGKYYKPDFYGVNEKGQRGRETLEGYSTDVITDKALSWLKQRDRTKPFMLVVGHKAPHRPWFPAQRHIGKARSYAQKLMPPATLWDDYANRPKALEEAQMKISRNMYIDSDLKINLSIVPEEWKNHPALKPKAPWGRGDDYANMTPAEKAKWDEYYDGRTRELIEGIKPGGKLNSEKALTEWKWRAYMEDYLGSLLAVDEGIGQLMDYLDREQLSENTLVVYCGDQSFYLGEHGWYDKRWAFEESMRMPLVMRWKGHIKPGSVCNELVQNIDYAPTFADVAHADSSEYGFQGRSLLPLLRTGGKAPSDWRQSLYYAFYENAEHNVARHDAVRTNRYMLAHLPKTDEWMFFDTEKDPQQMKNLINEPSYAKTIEALKKEYRRLRQVYEVPDGLPGNDNVPVKLNAAW